MTYEGARGINGPYLGSLGASATIVGFVAGFGELLGYSLRFFSGFLADKTKHYWTIAIIGYTINLFAVPLLALTNHWLAAAILMIFERVGKGIRNPSRDAMLSHSAQKLGAGWVFGLHHALDRTGAMLGPLIIALVLFLKENNILSVNHNLSAYHEAYALLAIPAIFSLCFLLFARKNYPNPQNLEKVSQKLEGGMDKTFWIYTIGSGLVAAGFADFSLMAYHFAKETVLSVVWIPISYGLAMGSSGLFSVIFGRLYDRFGLIILIITTILSSLFAILAFWGGFTLALVGLCLWSVGLGAHESLMPAVITKMVHKNKRASAYGAFNMVFGVAWFLGSVAMGALYDFSITSLIVFSVITQLASIPFFFIVMKLMKSS